MRIRIDLAYDDFEHHRMSVWDKRPPLIRQSGQPGKMLMLYPQLDSFQAGATHQNLMREEDKTKRLFVVPGGEFRINKTMEREQKAVIRG